MGINHCVHCGKWQAVGIWTRKHRQLGWCKFLKDYVAADKFCFNYKKQGEDGDD